VWTPEPVRASFVILQCCHEREGVVSKTPRSHYFSEITESSSCIGGWIGPEQVWQLNRREDNRCRYDASFRYFRLNILLWKSNKYKILWVCALVIQQANRIFMPRIVFPSLFSLSFPYLFHSIINGTTFGEKLLNIKCCYWYNLLFSSKTFFVLRIFQRDSITNENMSSRKVPVILVTF
jgi:hypothetical protein